jgi:hypothetical protein
MEAARCKSADRKPSVLEAAEMLISPVKLEKFELPRVENDQNGDGCMELDSSNRTQLLDHLLALDRHERNSRFQCGATNDFITSYFLSINWQRYLAIAWRKTGLVIGMAELASLTKSWRQPELAISIAPYCDAHYVRRRLIQAACVAAQNRGATKIILWFGNDEEWVPQLVRECRSKVDWHRQCATIPLNDIGRGIPNRIGACGRKAGIRVL